MRVMASQITSLTIVFSTVYSSANRRKHRSSVSLAFVRRIHRWPVNSPHKGPVTRKMLPFDDVIICACSAVLNSGCSSYRWMCAMPNHPFAPESLNPDSMVHGASMGPIWGRQDPGGPHVVPMNFAIWELSSEEQLMSLMRTLASIYNVYIWWKIIFRTKVD